MNFHVFCEGKTAALPLRWPVTKLALKMIDWRVINNR
jgi:hypothetical protein